VPDEGLQGKKDVQVPVVGKATRMNKEKKRPRLPNNQARIFSRIIRSFGQHVVNITQLCHLCLYHVAYPQI
jgi:hypothetical protein